ncbi:glycosyltransferase family 61 protein [Bacillus sp. C11]|nr:glycosyltransferase family 61 protein [Neobacillus terrae]
MTVAEQVALFSTSEVITPPRGEGLTNLTFCQPGTKVLEIFSPAYITCLYSMISSFGNLKHYYFIGDYGKRGPGMKEDWSGFDNMKITPKKFSRILNKMQFS